MRNYRTDRGYLLTDRAYLIFAAILFALLLAQHACAEQPECTGDRHYDGVACCPVPPTTPTTLPPQECPTACPDPGPCLPVTCTCESTQTVVEVARCPEIPAAPNYVPCRKRKDGTFKCPRPRAPRRLLMPEKDAQ